MTTNKTNVKRYDNMGCPEQICRADTMYESDDGDYVLYEDYEAIQSECEKLRKDAERYRFVRAYENDCFMLNTLQVASMEDLDSAIDAAIIKETSHDNQ